MVYGRMQSYGKSFVKTAPQNTANAVSRLSKKKNFLGGMPPDPPRRLAPSVFNKQDRSLKAGYATAYQLVEMPNTLFRL